MSYLGKVSLTTAEVCESLRELALLKYKWTWNSTYQNLYEKVKIIIKKNANMAFCNEKKQLYLETDTFGCHSQNKASAGEGCHAVPKD